MSKLPKEAGGCLIVTFCTNYTANLRHAIVYGEIYKPSERDLRKPRVVKWRR